MPSVKPNPHPHKEVAWIAEPFLTPPFSLAARVEAGKLLRRLQAGESLGLPHSRPMPGVGRRCHELRIQDENRIWRIVYRIDGDAIVIAAVFDKTTQKTTRQDIENCKDRLKTYDRDKLPTKPRKKGAQ